jgi:hypothetical protein
MRGAPAVTVQSAPGAKDAERDAPTVLTRERAARRWSPRIGWAVFGVAAVGAALVAVTQRPGAPTRVAAL